MLKHQASTLDPDGNLDAEAVLLYGLDWAEDMRALNQALQGEFKSIAARAHEYLAWLSDPSAPDPAFGAGPDHIEVYRAESLNVLTGPDLTEDRHRRLAVFAGRRNSGMRVDRPSLIRGHNFLYAEIRGRVDPSRHERALAVLSRRLIRDLAWQAEGYAALQTARYDTLLRLTHLAWEAENYTDLINRAAAILCDLDGVEGCTFGRPDQDGYIRYEAIAGNADIKRFLNILETSNETPYIGDGGPDYAKNGVTRRAWLSGQITACTYFPDDPLNPQLWKDLARDANLRSLISIPLCRPGDRPRAVLTLYGQARRGKAGAGHTNLVTQIQTLMMFSISRLEAQSGPTYLVPYIQRQRWISLLRTDALEMHYQPLLDLRTREISKVEARARLRDNGQLLAPGRFFPALSSDDFADLYVQGLRQSLAQRNRWLENGLDLQVSINLPSSALADARYFRATQHALGEYGSNPSKLTLEILETEEIPHGVDVITELGRFKSLGVRLAEDDLGSGYSSLNRLRELPFDIIKIDRSIVMNAHQDSSSVLRFIYQLTRLGHSLGKQVVVEGVETPDLLEAIAILGADVVQGYVVARPMPAEAIPDWIRGDALSALPQPGQARSLLARLAQLLIWEERMNLLLGELYEHKRAIDGQTSRAIFSNPDEALRRVRSLALALDGAELSLPFDDADTQAQQALVMAAVNHGLRSPEYAQRRQALILMLDAC